MYCKKSRFRVWNAAFFWPFGKLKTAHLPRAYLQPPTASIALHLIHEATFIFNPDPPEPCCGNFNKFPIFGRSSPVFKVSSLF